MAAVEPTCDTTDQPRSVFASPSSMAEDLLATHAQEPTKSARVEAALRALQLDFAREGAPGSAERFPPPVQP
eukprot:12213612-Alexandrium_andersonii.AAC.1